MGIIDYIEAKNRERVNRARREDSKKVGLGLLIGAAIGAGIGYAKKCLAEYAR